MITNGDRFVVNNLECSFRTPNSDRSPKGTLIHMGHEIRKQASKDARFSNELIISFAKAVEAAYMCKISVDFSANGFVFVFTEAPTKHILAEYEPIVVTCRDINAALRENDLQAESTMTFEAHFSISGLDVLRWFLDALSQKKHTTHVTAHEISWLPPPKPVRYTNHFPKSISGRDDEPPTRRNPMKK